LAIFRDGVQIDTLVAGPFTNPVTYIDHDPTIAVLHTYTAKHVAGGSYSPASNAEPVFAGPLPPTGFAQSSAPDHFGSYTVVWDPEGNSVELQDDFRCLLHYGTDLFSGIDDHYQQVIEGDLLPTHDTAGVNFHARLRQTVTAFTIDDVSDWTTTAITCAIYADNPDYNQHC
jgi:hypothetical protein